MKVEKKIISAIIIIILLTLLIVLPPLCRLFFPEMIESKPKNYKNVSSLICTKDYKDEQVLVTLEVKYIDAKINQTKIVYTDISENSQVGQIPDNSPAHLELANFKNISGVQILNQDKNTVVIINDDTIKKNPDNQFLKENYFNDQKTIQKINLINQGYQCREIKS